MEVAGWEAVAFVTVASVLCCLLNRTHSVLRLQATFAVAFSRARNKENEEYHTHPSFLFITIPLFVTRVITASSNMIRSQQVLLLLFFVTMINAFMQVPLPSQRQPSYHHHCKHNLQAFFDGWFGINKNDPQEQSDPAEYKDEDVEGIYTGSKRIITIPGK